VSDPLSGWDREFEKCDRRQIFWFRFFLQKKEQEKMIKTKVLETSLMKNIALFLPPPLSNIPEYLPTFILKLNKNEAQ